MRTIGVGILQAHLENRLDDDFSLDELTLDKKDLIDPFTELEYRMIRAVEKKDEEEKTVFRLISAGPDKTFGYQAEPFQFIAYDGTNGTKSAGDIVRVVTVKTGD